MTTNDSPYAFRLLIMEVGSNRARRLIDIYEHMGIGALLLMCEDVDPLGYRDHPFCVKGDEIECFGIDADTCYIVSTDSDSRMVIEQVLRKEAWQV